MKPPNHPLPSPGPTYELYMRSDGEYSEFPAALVNENTPSPQPSPPPFTQWPRSPRRLSSSPDPPQPSQSQRSPIQHPRRDFTSKDIQNTAKVSKSSLTRKRKVEALDISEDRSLKRKQKLTGTHVTVDMDLLKNKINNVVGRIGEIEALLKDVNSTLEDIL